MNLHSNNPNPLIIDLADITSQLKNKKKKPSENDKIHLKETQKDLLARIDFAKLFVNFRINNPQIQKNSQDKIHIINPGRVLLLSGGKLRKTRKKRKTRRIKRKTRRTKIL